MLGIHASAFPRTEADIGFGSPLSSGGDRLLAFAAALGFDTIQLGPAGQVSPINLSPYDGSVLARNPWSLGLTALASDEYAQLLHPALLESLQRQTPRRTTRVDAPLAAAASGELLRGCYQRFCELRVREPAHPLVVGLADFRRAHADWLGLNALYEVLAERVVDDPTRFEPALRALFEPGAAGLQRRAAMRATLGAAIELRELAQYLCHLQHDAFRAHAHAQKLAIWGDMQVGYSHRDRFLHAEAFATRWLLGAPPSRTNPQGQPWGYPLLDPDQLADPQSPARRLFALRARKLLAEYDGVRIDHPHGLVCPWVYRADDPNPQHAVKHGARVFESPDRDDPDLQRWAIAQLTDLAPDASSHFADDWVRTLAPDQLDRYACHFDVLAALCPGAPASQTFAAEVLSTCPHPLRAVLARHGLGRFRVTQKANPGDVQDPYRTEHARPEDWLMLGTHDTPPIFPVAGRWLRDGSAHARAAYLAERLIAEPSERAAASNLFASSEHQLLRASLADLFGSGAQHVYIFIGDLFGEHEPYNRAGITHPDNWTARLPEDFEHVYHARVKEGRALDIVGAAKLALERRLA
ncbi:MAG: 4-alpha-glucanotransferase [Polyangiales bacterium]